MWKPFSGLHRTLLSILKNTERIMVDLTNLQAAVTLEATEVGLIVAEVSSLETQIKALQSASAAGDQSAVDSAAASIQSSITALKESLATANEAQTGTSNNPAPIDQTPPDAQSAPASPADQAGADSLGGV